MKPRPISEFDIDLFHLMALWPSFVVAVIALLLGNSIWNSISGLYFPAAGTVIFMSILIYYLLSLNNQTPSTPPNKTKLTILLLTAMALFSPAAYLYFTEQLSLRQLLSNDFNPTLNHLPYANLLPFLCVVVIVTPINDFLRNK